MKRLLSAAGLSFVLMLPLASQADWNDSEVNQLLDSNAAIQSAIEAGISREDLAKALINYEAKARFNEWQQRRENFFMMAPGSPDAIQAGQDVGSDAVVTANAKNLSSQAIAAGLSLGGGGVPGSHAITDKAEPFLESGDANQLGSFNAANILQEDNVPLSSSQEFINLLTNPIPGNLNIVKQEIGNEIKWGGDGTNRDQVADAMIEQTVMSVAANALGEIAAKRVVNPDTSKSVAQVLREESNRRFSSDSWYQNVGVSSQEALLREIASMQAYELKLRYEQYRLQEQHSALLSAMLASLAKMTGAMNMLNKQMKQANSSVDEFKDVADEIDLDDFNADDFTNN